MKKEKIILGFLVLIAIFAFPNVVKAGFQSKPGSALTSKTADYFFEGCRKMEAKGGVLGLSESINSTTYIGTTGNGIDAHMALNTEWGAIALLTDSGYGIGKGISGKSTKTSTDNATGVYNLADGTWEYVASTYSGTTSSYNEKMRGADARYFSSYSSQTPKAGDALQCTNWLSASYTSWTYASFPVFRRGFGGLFGFSGGTGSGDSISGSRAVVVCGAGL